MLNAPSLSILRRMIGTLAVAVFVATAALSPAVAQEPTPVPPAPPAAPGEGIPPTPTPVAPPPPGVRPPVVCASGKSVVVKAGDNLYRIGLSVGLSWIALQNYNGLPNANLIYVGQTLCIPDVPPATITPVPVVTVTPPPPPTGIVLPAKGFPSITLDRYTAKVGENLVISGTNFPTNEPSDIQLAPGFTEAWVAVATTTTTATGTVNVAFTIPTTLNGQPLTASSYRVRVIGKTTRYNGFNFFHLVR